MYTGPHIIKDGLVFGYDTGYGIADNDTATRFYPGESTDNILRLFTSYTLSNPNSIYRCTVTEQNTVDATAPNGQYSRYTGIDTNSNNQVFYSYAGASFDYTGNTMTYSVYLKGEGTCHLTNYNDQTGYSTSSTITLTDKWTRYSYTSFVHANANNHWSGVRGIRNDTDVYVAASQTELKGHATPFTATTRSSTASLIDLKETTDIDVSNVSFSSTGQPTFDGTSDYISKTRRQYTTEAWSVEIIFKPTDATDTSWNGLFGGNLAQGGYWFFHSAGNLALYSSAGYLSYRSWTKANTFTVDEFHHLVITYTPATTTTGTFNLYYNGGEKTDSFNFTFANIYTLDSQYIGMGGGNRFGTNDVAVYKEFEKVLSAEEVAQNYNAYKNRFDI